MVKCGENVTVVLTQFYALRHLIITHKDYSLICTDNVVYQIESVKEENIYL
jgi:hypothetical protein